MDRKFSVLMAVYRNDRVDHFLEAVDSVMAQSLSPNEIIIVRDGPVPSALQSALDKLKADYPDLFTLVQLDANGGLAAALNRGLTACRYDLVVRQDADDISEPQRFEKQITAICSDSDLALVGSGYDQYDFAMEKKTSSRRVPEAMPGIVRFARHRTPFNHACAVFRKSDVLAVGGYPSIDGLCEDWWLALRLIKAGKRMCNLPESLVRVRGGEDFYRRRSGWRYIKQELASQIAMGRGGLLKWSDVLINIAIRVPSRLVPAGLLELLYRYGIRKMR